MLEVSDYSSSPELGTASIGYYSFKLQHALIYTLPPNSLINLMQNGPMSFKAINLTSRVVSTPYTKSQCSAKFRLAVLSLFMQGLVYIRPDVPNDFVLNSPCYALISPTSSIVTSAA